MRKLLLFSAFFCLFLSRSAAQGCDSLLVKARSFLDQNHPKEAALTFEKVLVLDSTNYESHAFLGNYYYLQGKNASEKADLSYQAIAQPNRMQMAHYQDELKRIYFNYYEKANGHLQRALTLQANEHLEKLVQAIQAYRDKNGLDPVSGKKKGGSSRVFAR